MFGGSIFTKKVFCGPSSLWYLTCLQLLLSPWFASFIVQNGHKEQFQICHETFFGFESCHQALTKSHFLLVFGHENSWVLQGCKVCYFPIDRFNGGQKMFFNTCFHEKKVEK